MLTLIKLELHKNRLLFLGLLTLSFICGLAHVAIGFFWLFVTLTGASCGAQFRAAMKAEEDFPQTPQLRIRAALLAGLLISVCIVFAGFAGHMLAERKEVFHFFDSIFVSKEMPAFFVLHIALYIFAFLLAFATNTGVLGGAMAIALAPLTFGAFYLTMFFMESDLPYIAGYLSTLGLAINVVLACVLTEHMASAVARGTKRWSYKVTALIVWPFLLPIAPVCTRFHAELTALHPVGHIPMKSICPEIKTRAPLHDGVLVYTLAGNVYYLHPDGSKKFILKLPHRLRSSEILSCWTPDGELWLLDASFDGAVKFYRGSQAAPAVFYSSTSANGYLNELVLTPEGLRSAKFRPTDRAAHEGKWETAQFPLFENSKWDDKYAVKIASSVSVAIPGARGHVAEYYETEYGRLSGGGYAVMHYPYKLWWESGKRKPVGPKNRNYILYSMANDGGMNKPLVLPEYPAPLRVEKGRVFILDRNTEIKIADTNTGKITLLAHTIPRTFNWTDGHLGCRDGVFIFSGTKTVFYDWNGNSRKI
jgi:hypothetical protein